MAYSEAYSDLIVRHENIPPRVLPQKRALFENVPSNDWQRLLPTEYKKVAKALDTVDKDKVDLREVIDPDRSRYTKELFELALLTFNYRDQIDYLLRKFYILENCPLVDKWVATVLVAEMLWGKQQLLSCSDEVEAIRYFEEELRESFVEVMDIFRSPLNLTVSTTLPVYVRVNLLSISVEEAIQGFKIEGWQLLPPCETYMEHLQKLGYLSEGNFMKDFHIPELFAFPPGTSFYNHSGYLGGKLLLQDKGSCLASSLLNPKPGSIVLDVFSAPGLKTNHFANVMNNNGLIFANDIHPERFTTMSKILDLTNVKCAQLIGGHYLDLKDCNATHILIDPTCSYSGIFSKKEKYDQKTRINDYNSSLTDALRYVLTNFHNAQRVVFTTCSIFPEEGEKVVDDVLREIGESFVLLDLKKILWNEWMNVGSLKYKCGSKCLRTLPEFDLCQGCFIAVFERSCVVAVPPYPMIPPVKERCRMRIAANGDILYEDNNQLTLQHSNNNVNHHHNQTEPEQQYQYMYSESSSSGTLEFPIHRY